METYVLSKKFNTQRNGTMLLFLRGDMVDSHSSESIVDLGPASLDDSPPLSTMFPWCDNLPCHPVKNVIFAHARVRYVLGPKKICL